jgi:hypothetical protein
MLPVLLKDPGGWAQLDLELESLDDRVRSSRGTLEDSSDAGLLVEFFVTSLLSTPFQDPDIKECANRLLPRFSKRERIRIGGVLNYQMSMEIFGVGSVV